MPFGGAFIGSSGRSFDDAFIADDFEPHPPDTDRPQLARSYTNQRRMHSSQKNEMRWTKTHAKANTPKKGPNAQAVKYSPSKAHRRHMGPLAPGSPNFRELHEKRLNMLKVALAEQEAKNPKPNPTAGIQLTPIQRDALRVASTYLELDNIEREQRNMLALQEESVRESLREASDRLRRQLMAPNVPFQMLEVQEAYMRQAIHQQLCTYWNGEARKLRVAGTSQMVQRERESRIVILQEEMDRRTVLLGMWLGVDTSELPKTRLLGGDLLQEEEEFKRRELSAAATLAWCQFQEEEGLSRETAVLCGLERTKQSVRVLMETAKHDRIAVATEESKARKSVLQKWLDSSGEMVSFWKTADIPVPRMASAGSYARRSSVEVEPRRRSASSGTAAPAPAHPTTHKRPVTPPPQGVFVRSRQLEAGAAEPLTNVQYPPPSDPNPNPKPLSRSLLQERLEASLSLQSALETAIAAIQLSEDASRKELLANEKRVRALTVSGFHSSAPAAGPSRPDEEVPKEPTPHNSIIEQQQQQQQSQALRDDTERGNGTSSGGGHRNIFFAPSAQQQLGGGRPGTGGSGTGGSGSGRGGAGGAGGPPPPANKPPLNPKAAPRLFRAVVRVLAKDMALCIQHEDVLRKCTTRTEVLERHRIGFKIWRWIQEQMMPKDEAGRASEQMRILLEEEALNRHVLEAQEDNSMLMLWWTHHSTYERNYRLERRL